MIIYDNLWYYKYDKEITYTFESNHSNKIKVRLFMIYVLNE
jgi:hypothetical protein